MLSKTQKELDKVRIHVKTSAEEDKILLPPKFKELFL